MTDPRMVSPSHRAPSAPPVLDPHTVACGEPLEDYGWLAGVQGHRPRGPRLLWQGWFLLAEALRHQVARGRLNPTRARQVDALTDAGLLERGRVTDAGRPIAEVLSQPGPRLTVHARSTGDRHHAMDILVAGPSAVVLASAPPYPAATGLNSEPGDGTGDDPNLLTLDLVDLTWLPVSIAAWTGTVPTWTFGISPDTVDHGLFMRRLHGQDVPPPEEADAHLREVWQQRPWWWWRLTAPGTPRQVDVLHAGDRGCYEMTAGEAEGTVRLIPTPSFVIWHVIVEITNAAVTGQ
jgi:hypothetical protein